MNIFISTVQRPGRSPYLDRCIESIRQDFTGDIHLVIGGEDTAYTDKYTDGFIKHFIGKEESTLQDSVQKAGYGYATCLSLDTDMPALIVEDDAVFVKDWYAGFKSRLQAVNMSKYVISLLSPWYTAVANPGVEFPCLQEFLYTARLSYDVLGQIPTANTITYANTTAIYYPVSVLKTHIAAFVKRFAVEDEGVYDLVVGYWFFRMNIPIYIATPNLLAHVDTVDSAMGSTIRRFHVNYDDWDYTKW